MTFDYSRLLYPYLPQQMINFDYKAHSCFQALQYTTCAQIVSTFQLFRRLQSCLK